jgi:hypothetical protein
VNILSLKGTIWYYSTKQRSVKNVKNVNNLPERHANIKSSLAMPRRATFNIANTYLTYLKI